MFVLLGCEDERGDESISWAVNSCCDVLAWLLLGLEGQLHDQNKHVVNLQEQIMHCFRLVFNPHDHSWFVGRTHHRGCVAFVNAASTKDTPSSPRSLCSNPKPDCSHHEQ